MTDTILLVDDEQHIIDLAKMYLEQEGWKTTSATDGLVALQRILSEKPALVVLDLMLPGLDGWEVCRRVRAQSAERQLGHVVALVPGKIDVEIGRRRALGIDKAFEIQVEFERLHVGDVQAVGHDGVGAAAAPAHKQEQLGGGFVQ